MGSRGTYHYPTAIETYQMTWIFTLVQCLQNIFVRRGVTISDSSVEARKTAHNVSLLAWKDIIRRKRNYEKKMSAGKKLVQ